MAGGGVQKHVLVVLATAAIALTALAALALGLAAGLRGDVLVFAVVASALLSLGLLLLWQAWSVTREHFVALERLKGAVISLAGSASARLPVPREDGVTAEIRDLHLALAALDARFAQERSAPDTRLQAVVASIPDALLVLSLIHI